jgi:hypothetical protein
MGFHIEDPGRMSEIKCKKWQIKNFMFFNFPSCLTAFKGALVGGYGASSAALILPSPAEVPTGVAAGAGSAWAKPIGGAQRVWAEGGKGFTLKTSRF